MSREDTYQSRSPIAQRALNELKAEREWASLDAARIGGRATELDFRDLDYSSNREIVSQYLEREALREAYQDERR